jgi:hypothetical protein
VLAGVGVVGGVLGGGLGRRCEPVAGGAGGEAEEGGYDGEHR